MGRCGLRFLPAHRSPCQRGHTALHIDRLTSDYTKKLKRCLTMTVHGAIPGNTTRNYVYGSPIQALKKGLPSVANRIRYGTSLSKNAGGVQRNSSAPAIPPTRLGRIRMRNRGSASRNSRRYPHALPSVPGQIATVLVAFAVTEFSPSQISTGKETSVPPPATELMAPARNAEPKATAACVRSKYAILTRARQAWLRDADNSSLPIGHRQILSSKWSWMPKGFQPGRAEPVPQHQYGRHLCGFVGLTATLTVTDAYDPLHPSVSGRTVVGSCCWDLKGKFNGYDLKRQPPRTSGSTGSNVFTLFCIPRRSNDTLKRRVVSNDSWDWPAIVSTFRWSWLAACT